MSAQTAATRIRRTFAYPSESDDEDAVEAGMDERDQAELVQDLSKHDTRTTSTYTHLLLVLPLLPVLLYLPLLFRISTILPAVAATSSLLASAYTLYYLPLSPVKISITTMSDLQGESRKPKPQETKVERRPVPWLSSDVAHLLAEYIVIANEALCGILAVIELLQRRTWAEGMAVGGGYLPALILVVVMFARRELRAVDMSDLERLRTMTKNT